MIQIRKSEERGYADHGWLKSHHTFSFAEYHDRNHMAFRTIRVINEDFVAAGKGFDTHPHANMEIVSYIVSGSLAHKDSMGNVKAVAAGEVQAMTAGSGVTHSEFNPSESEPVHLLQIWIMPRIKGLTPSYSELKPTPEQEKREMLLIASPDGREGSVRINQDVELYRGKFPAGKKCEMNLTHGGKAWVQLIEGELEVNGQLLRQGDAAGAQEEEKLTLVPGPLGAHFLLFDTV